MRSTRLGLAAVLLTAALACPGVSRACGPWIEGAYFTFTKHPDPPFDSYAGGQLGIVHPTFARSYLVVAYRTLAGHALDETQQQDVVSLWNDRVDLIPGPGMGITEVWLDARARVEGPGDRPTIQVHRVIPGTRWGNYLNCTPDAFETAARTLDQLIAELGLDSPHVDDWVALQDQVFANCGEGQVVPRLPDRGGDAGPPPASIRAHRAYQAASACFYAEQFPEARRRFGAIASDRTSPWAPLAPYLALRAAVRKATLTQDRIDVAALADVGERVTAQLAAGPSAEIGPHLLGLLDYIAFRTRPSQQIEDLAFRLQEPSPATDMRHMVDDYTRLLDEQMYASDPTQIRDDDLTDWVLMYQGHREGALEQGIQRWTDTGSTAWLLAALTWVTPEFERLEYLLAGAAAISPGDPAYPTAAFHQARLLTATGRPAEARTVLDAALGLEPLDEASRNALLAQRLHLARDLDEFVALAPRTCTGVGFDYSEGIPVEPADGTPPLIDVDAAALITAAMPMSMALDVARRDSLSTEVRQRIAVSVWVRATLLEEHDLGQEAARLAAEIRPALAPYLADYVAATTDADRHHAAVFALLQLPGATPRVLSGLGRRTAIDELDSYRDNWWAGPAVNAWPSESDPLQVWLGGHLLRVYADWEVVPVSFLDEDQLAALTDEHERLLALPIAPDYLCQQAIALAQALPDDPRAPHALHRAVRAVRVTTTGAETGDWSRRAFEHLHREYAGSAWAEKTPYWYN